MGIIFLWYFSRVGGWVVCLYIMENLCNLLVLLGGICYNIYILDVEEVSILIEFEIVAGELKRYTGVSSQVIIPEGVAIIGEGAFKDCRGLTDVKIPESVFAIESEAFYNSGIRQIIIPKNVTKVGGYSFYNCENLLSVHFEGNISKIGARTFGGCKSLENVNIPEGVCEIDYGAFENCCNLKFISIPKSVSIIKGDAFCNCINLQKVEFKGNPTFTHDDDFEVPAFFGCKKLEDSSQIIHNGFQPSIFRAMGLYSLAEKAQRELWKQQGVCAHCGGSFITFFSTKCRKCGWKKDY